MRVSKKLTGALLFSSLLSIPGVVIAAGDTQVISTSLTNPIAMGNTSPLIGDLSVVNPGSLRVTGVTGVGTAAVFANHQNPNFPESVFITVGITQSNNGYGIQGVGPDDRAIEINGSANNSNSNTTAIITLTEGAKIKAGKWAISDITQLNAAESGSYIITNAGTIESEFNAAITDDIGSNNSVIINQKTGVILGGKNAPAISVGFSNIANPVLLSLDNQGKIYGAIGQTGVDGVFANQPTFQILNFNNSGLISGHIGVNISKTTTSLVNSGTIQSIDTGADPIAVKIGTGMLTLNNGSQILGNIVEDDDGLGAGGNAVIKVDVGLGNIFTTNGKIDNVNRIDVESGSLVLNHSITTLGNLNLKTGTLLQVAANQTVAGAFDLQEGSITTLSIRDINNFGKLSALNLSKVSGTVTLDINQSAFIANNASFEIFKANAGISETATTVYNLPNSAMLTFVKVNQGDRVNVNVTRLPLTQFVQNTQGQVAFAQTLENLASTTTNADFLNLMGGFNTIATAAEVERALKSLKLPENGANLKGTIQGLSALQNVMQKHMTLARAASVDEDLPSSYSAGDVGASGSWGQIFFDHGKQRKRLEVTGYNADTFGLSFGYDQWINELWQLGGALTYGNGRVHADGGPRFWDKIKTVQGSLYAGYELSRGFLDTVLSYAYDRHRTLRNVQLGFVNRYALSKHAGYSSAVSIRYACEWFNRIGMSMIPHVGIDYRYARERGFDEYNAGSASLRLDEQRYSQLQAGTGLKVSKAFKVKDGQFVPDAHVGISYDLDNKAPQVKAAFVQLPASFYFVGAKEPHWSFKLGMGAMLKSGRFKTKVNYDVHKKDLYLGHSGNLSFSVDI